MDKHTGGLNESEKYLSKLCKRTFLSLWSFPNLFRQKGSELCDLLVTCGDDIIIFSDKACQYPNTGNPELDWTRWFKRAVAASAKQLWGAQQWIQRHPDRIYHDSKCEKTLRKAITLNAESRIHLVLVAHGASAACVETYQGSGSLIIDNIIKGTENHTEPFKVGDIDPDKTFIHILDDFSLDILLETRDTISDFTNYLKKREQLLRLSVRIYSPGEEEMLGHYLEEMNEDGEHDFVLPASDKPGYAFRVGIWENFKTHHLRLSQIEADKISYFWDELIERFNRHTINDTQYFVTDGGYTDAEKAIRFLAQENRFNRRMLAASLIEMIQTTPKHLKKIRVANASRNNLYFVTLLFPYLPEYYQNNYDLYRELRRFYLTATVQVIRLQNPEAEHVVGIAMESGLKPTNSSEDLVYFDCSGWNDQLEKQVIQDQQELGILLNPKRFEINHKEYPD